jgi:T4 bacteriophage base plate protein
MSLPKVSQPLFEMTVPSSKKKVTFRPFLVKEEKILLIAQQGDEDSDIIRAIKQVLQNCIQDDIKIDSLTTFDLEYMFLKLRAKSVNNIVKLSYRDNEDDELYEFEVDLDTIEVTFNGANNPKIKINDQMGMHMKYPSAAITDNLRSYNTEVELMTFFISNCIDTIYDDAEVYVASEYSEEEINEFLDSLDVNTFDKIRVFFETMPKLYHKLEYTNKLNNKRTIELTNLKDFFMWG